MRSIMRNRHDQFDLEPKFIGNDWPVPCVFIHLHISYYDRANGQSGHMVMLGLKSDSSEKKSNSNDQLIQTTTLLA